MLQERSGAVPQLNCTVNTVSLNSYKISNNDHLPVIRRLAADWALFNFFVCIFEKFSTAFLMHQHFTAVSFTVSLLQSYR